MAITTIGPPLAGIRGTIGGITFSANKGGPYAKIWTPSTNPRTQRQSLERAYLSRMPGLWTNLTGAQRGDWDTFAALPAQELTNSLGAAYYISGFGWFCKCNVRILRTGIPTIVPFPAQARPAAPTISAVRVCPTGSESDQCTCGVATSSTQNPGNPPTQAFDDNLGLWFAFIQNTTTGWLQYVFCDPVNIKRYRIYAYSALYSLNPGTWTFQVWTGGAWETLQTVTGETWTTPGWKDYFIINPYTETTYRINISANQGNPTWCSIVEMEMYLADVGASCIIYPEDEFDNAPDWALILFVSMSNTQGRTVQYQGFYETLALESPSRSSENFQTNLETAFGEILIYRKWFTRAHRQTQEGLRSPATVTNVVSI